MNVVDSSGWLEYFEGGQNANFFAPAIQDLEHLIVPAICIYEVFKRVLMQRNEQDALRAVGVMSLGAVVNVDRQLAINAAQISLASKLAMADSLILATARAHQATLWTQDEHFIGLDDVKFTPKISDL
ncbi:MAG: hypothetical protein Fur0022_38560 [Anaerolineales bacterium]